MDDQLARYGASENSGNPAKWKIARRGSSEDRVERSAPVAWIAVFCFLLSDRHDDDYAMAAGICHTHRRLGHGTLIVTISQFEQSHRAAATVASAFCKDYMPARAGCNHAAAVLRSMLIWVLRPASKPITAMTTLSPEQVRRGAPHPPDTSRKKPIIAGPVAARR